MNPYWKSVVRGYSRRMRDAAKAMQDTPELTRLREVGWCRFAADADLIRWIHDSRATIDQSIRDPENAHWLRYDGTWFAGVNVLPNDDRGAVPNGPPLSGRAVSFIHDRLGHRNLPWDRAQVSVCYPGYPRPVNEESDAVFAFRRDRDAAHIDGLLKDGPNRQRYLREHHAFILGIPVSTHDDGAAPFTVWEGSHRLIGDWLRDRLGDIPTCDWDRCDLTEEYTAIRREAFRSCRRVPIPAQPGEAYLVHRHALHGMAPWADGAASDSGGRIIVYFRPPMNNLEAWLSASD